jgi:hypothetical protein
MNHLYQACFASPILSLSNSEYFQNERDISMGNEFVRNLHREIASFIENITTLTDSEKEESMGDSASSFEIEMIFSNSKRAVTLLSECIETNVPKLNAVLEPLNG